MINTHIRGFRIDASELETREGLNGWTDGEPREIYVNANCTAVLHTAHGSCEYDFIAGNDHCASGVMRITAVNGNTLGSGLIKVKY